MLLCILHYLFLSFTINIFYFPLEELIYLICLSFISALHFTACILYSIKSKLVLSPILKQWKYIFILYFYLFIINILPLNIYLNTVTQVLLFKFFSYKILPRLRVSSSEEHKYMLCLELVGNFPPFKNCLKKWIDLVIILKGHFHLLLTFNLSISLGMAINRHCHK